MPQIKQLSSKDAQKTSKIIGCDLIPYKVKGKLEFKKLGNAYLYSKKSLEKIKPNSLQKWVLILLKIFPRKNPSAFPLISAYFSNTCLIKISKF